MAATAASIATPTALSAKECSTAGLDWITMSLEARNLAYNNVEHVGTDNARKKTEGWAAASKTLREQRSQHLDLAYGNGERNKWDLYPAGDPKAPCRKSDEGAAPDAMKGALVARRRRWLAERLCANAGRAPRRDVRPQGGTRPGSHGSAMADAQRSRSCRPVTSCKSMTRLCGYSWSI